MSFAAGAGRLIWGTAALAIVLLLFGSWSASAAIYQATVGNGGTPGCASTWYFSSQMTGTEDCAVPNRGNGWDIAPNAATVGGGQAGEFQVNAPAGLTIISAQPQGWGFGWSSGYGWQAGGYWQGGSDVWPANQLPGSGAINSSYYGFKLYCYASSCTGWNNAGFGAHEIVSGVNLSVQENQSPSVVAIGANNLWYAASHWVWNPAGDPFSIEFQASDPSGVCNVQAYAQTLFQGPSSAANVNDGFQQCPTPVDWSPAQGAEVDTSQIVPPGSSGSFPLTLVATNAAGLTSPPWETVSVDDVQPSVSISTPNDLDRSAWVGHAVSVVSGASAGPSGVGGHDCSIDGHNTSYPAGGLFVDGTGTHTIACDVWNNSFDPQGVPNSSSTSTSVKIDETPPALSFEPENPAAPTDVVVDTSDGQSGMAGGSIAIAPAGSGGWSSVSSSFDGSHVIGQINDAGLRGPYVIRATSCDNVGNCGTSTETLTMPLRVAAVSNVSFAKVFAPSIVVHRRVLVGWRWRQIRINGKLVRARIGGHFKRIAIVIGRNASCAQKRVRTGPHVWRRIRVCRTVRISLVSHERVRFGRAVRVHGVLVSAQGVPIAGASVRILTSPNNGLGQFSQATTVTTAVDGAWSATLPAGPSRRIMAEYDGSGRVLPAAGSVSVSVPARIKLTASARALPWNGKLTLSGHLVGGYVPPDGVALRLLIRYAGIRQASVLLALRTDSAGRFRIQFRFPGAGGVQGLPFWVATTAAETDYPFAPSISKAVWVTFGSSTPPPGGVGSGGSHHGFHHHRRGHHRRHRRSP